VLITGRATSAPVRPLISSPPENSVTSTPLQLYGSPEPTSKPATAVSRSVTAPKPEAMSRDPARAMRPSIPPEGIQQVRWA
jgi:hypothetical protein